jgi:hypothetical protein
MPYVRLSAAIGSADATDKNPRFPTCKVVSPRYNRKIGLTYSLKIHAYLFSLMIETLWSQLPDSLQAPALAKVAISTARD